MTIYVSIAAYRDPQLGPTITDLVAKARWPGDLRIGVCWQHGDDEARPGFADDPRARWIDVPWRESRGACWARSELMKRWEGEDWFLQLDSHHRFVEGWDARLMALAERCESPRPVLTAYAPAFDPDDPARRQMEATQMNFDHFTAEGIVLFRPTVMPGWRTRAKPQRARFLSGHFLFAQGRFVEDVPYDPALYFIGEEITLSVRAHTQGYDLFHPHEVVLWHEYTRAYRPHKHWVDHVPGSEVAETWTERDLRSKQRVRALLRGERVEGVGNLGTVRSLDDYERFAGLSFRHRIAQEATRRNLEPPNAPQPSDWPLRNAPYHVEAHVEREALPPGSDEADFWFFGLHDLDGREVHRADLDREALTRALSTEGPLLTVSRRFVTDREVARWTLWPHHPTRGWLSTITGDAVHVPRSDVATFVTALVDVGRASLAPSFARSFEAHYLAHFDRLLDTTAPMVIFTEARFEARVWARRERHNTRVVTVSPEVLEGFPWFDDVQAIRGRAAWRAQAPWLAESPQAALAHYNPLVMSKLLWLDGVARTNPFETDAVFWVDAALAHTVPAALLTDPDLPRRLAECAGEFGAVAFPYEGAEIHGFDREAMRARAGCTRIERVVRGGLFGGAPGGVSRVASAYVDALQETLPAGLMGTEESVFTLLHHRDPSLFRVFEVGADGLMAPFVRAALDGRADGLRVRGDGRASVTGHTEARVTGGLSPGVAVYAQSFEAPGQLARWFERARQGMPEVFEQPTRVLLDNSRDGRFAADYDALAAAHGFTVHREGNLGVTGGRLWTARHFDGEAREGAALHFEDDMLVQGPPGVCRLGYPTRVERLWHRALGVLRASPEVDFLKLSFTEVHGDHGENWAWHNLEAPDRAAYFPRGHATQITAVRAFEGLPYAVGEVYYSNWPTLFTRRGNRVLLASPDAPAHEGLLMARWLKLARAGTLTSAVLLASPIEHCREVQYDEQARRE